MDIKMVWIPSASKNTYLLFVIDVHTRRILEDYFSFSIKQGQVIALLSLLFESYQYPESVAISSDNGASLLPAMCANTLRLFVLIRV
jgi:transposase InsO family protein